MWRESKHCKIYPVKFCKIIEKYAQIVFQYFLIL